MKKDERNLLGAHQERVQQRRRWEEKKRRRQTSTYHAICHLGHDADHGPDVFHRRLLSLARDGLKHWPSDVLLQKKQRPKKMNGLDADIDTMQMFEHNDAPYDGCKVGGDAEHPAKLELGRLRVEVIFAVSGKGGKGNEVDLVHDLTRFVPGTRRGLLRMRMCEWGGRGFC